MKDTIKNSIIGAFAIFGFISLISSYTKNKELSSSVVIDNSNFEMHKLENNTLMIFDKQNGIVSYEKITENYLSEYVEISGKIQVNVDYFPSIRIDDKANTLYLNQGTGTQYGDPWKFKNESY